MQIFVKALTGKSIALDVEPSTMIEHVQIMIYDKEGVPVDAQCLVHAGRNISVSNRVCECPGPGAGRSLEDFNIGPGTSLHLVGRLRPSLPICVFVKMPPGNIDALSLESSQSDLFGIKVDDVKRSLNKQWGVAVERQELMFGGKVLEDGSSLLDLGMTLVHYCKECKHGAADGPGEKSIIEMKPTMLSVSMSKESGQLTIRVTNLAGEEVVRLHLNAETATLGELNQSVLKHRGPGFLLVAGDGSVLTGTDDSPLEKYVDAAAMPATSMPALARTESEELVDTEICVMDEEECSDGVKKIIKLFEEYDVNDDKILDRSELKALLSNLSPPPGKPSPTDKEFDFIVNNFLLEADTNQDGRIDLPEFVRWLWRRPTSKQLPGDPLHFPPRLGSG